MGLTYKSSLAKAQAVSKVLPILATPTAPGPSPLVALDQPWRSFDLQQWVTIRANASGPSPCACPLGDAGGQRLDRSLAIR